MKPQHLVLSGSFSTGKTTVLEQLKTNATKHHVVQEGGRTVLSMKEKQVDTMTENERRKVQQEIRDFYLLNEKKAEQEGKSAVMDASLIEVLAYGMDVMTIKELHELSELLKKRSEVYRVVYFPVDGGVTLEKDGLRHTNDDFRKTIDSRILHTIKEFQFQCVELVTLDKQDRIHMTQRELQTMAIEPRELSFGSKRTS